MPAFDKVAILGVGLLGGSVGLALRRAGFEGEIAGFGRRRSSLDAARRAGAIDAGFLDLRRAIADAGLVLLASPLGLFERLLAESARWLASGTLVTDVGSTKRQVVRWAGRLLPKAVGFVGSHPIAGSDRRGVQYARADLFDGACCVLTPTRRSDARAVRKIDQFWQALGTWTVRLTPAAHDRYLAQVSHLPHAAAAALTLLAGTEAQDLAGPGFLDSTRIAGGDPELWRDIFLTNADQVAGAIRRLTGQLDRLARLIERRDGRALVRLLAEAQSRRHELMQRKLKRRQLEG